MNFKLFMYGSLFFLFMPGHAVSVSRNFSHSETYQDTFLLTKRRLCPEDRRQGCRKPSRSSKSITIISPPGGNLLEMPSLFSWYAPNFPDGQEFTVTLKLSGAIVWQPPGTLSTELEYSGEALGVDKYYELMIEAGEQYSANVGFKILDDATRQEVRDRVRGIKNKDFSLDQEVLEIARLYQEPQYNLVDSAIKELRIAVDNNIRTPEIYLMLGEIYEEKVEAYILAEEAYRNALNLAENRDDPLLRAEAQISIGKVLTLSGAKEQEARWQEGLVLLESAYDNYLSVNELGKAAEVAEFLGETYQELENRDEAVRWYQRAEEGYGGLGQEYWESLQRVKEALSYLD